MPKNPYHILGLRHGASREEIKKAYRKKALQWHPDRNSSGQSREMFELVTAAYDKLISGWVADSPNTIPEPPQKDPAYKAAKTKEEYNERKRAAVARWELRQKLKFSREKRALQSSVFYPLIFLLAHLFRIVLHLTVALTIIAPAYFFIEVEDYDGIEALIIIIPVAFFFHHRVKRYWTEVGPYFKKSDNS